MRDFGRCLNETRISSDHTSGRLGVIFNQLRIYGVVGIATNLIVYLIYLLLTYYDIDPKVAMTVLYGVGAILGFIANKKITFQHKGKTLRASVRYIFVQLAGYLLNLILLILFVDWLGFSHKAVQAVAILIVAGFLFVLYRSFVFAEPSVGSETTTP